MRSIPNMLLLLIAGWTLTGGTIQAQSPDEKFLVVGDDTLSTWYFTKSYIHHLRSTGLNDTREERYAHLDVLINESLLSQQAGDLKLDDKDQAQFREKVKKKIRSDIFYNRAFMDTLSLPSDLEIREAFFKSKMKIYASHLFFTDEERAERYFQRIKDGESFTDLANELYDTATYDSLAGYLGEMTYFSVDADVAEILFDMKAGQISQPVRSRFGYHIFRVEERIANPIITEAEFQYRYEGITDQEKRRILAMKGDRFIRDYMGSLRISVDTSVVKQLYTALSDIGNDPSGPLQQAIPRESLSDTERQSVESMLNPQSTVATYEHMGKINTFTVADYLFWLEFLPLSEAKYRTMASVGRALRNEVFAEAASELDLDNDRDFQFEVTYHMDNYNSWRVKKYLLDQDKIPVPESVQRRAYRGYGLDGVRSAQVTGWSIAVSSLDEARTLKQQILNGETDPEMVTGYRRYDDEDVRTDYDLRGHLFRVVPGSVNVAQTPEGYYVFFVEDRDIDRKTFEESRDEVIRRMGNTYNITHRLRELRSMASIAVDTAMFESLMEHFNDPALRGQNP